MEKNKTKKENLEGWRGSQFVTFNRVIREGLVITEQVMTKQSLEGDEGAFCRSEKEQSKQRGRKLPSPLEIGVLKNTKKMGAK